MVDFQISLSFSPSPALCGGATSGGDDGAAYEAVAVRLISSLRKYVVE